MTGSCARCRRREPTDGADYCRRCLEGKPVVCPFCGATVRDWERHEPGLDCPALNKRPNLNGVTFAR
jgi:hypothetical protein